MEKVEKIVIEKTKRLCDHSLDEFTAALASSAPTPGGGAAAAYAGAMGLACGLMVCELTLGSDECAAVHAEAEALKKDLEAMRAYLVRQVDEDAMAYQPLKKHLASPKDAPGRDDHIQAALRVACQVPTEVMYTAGRGIELLSALAEKGAAKAVSEAGAGVELCRASLLAAQQSILLNACSITDEVYAMTLRIECGKVREQYMPIADEAMAKVKARLEK